VKLFSALRLPAFLCALALISSLPCRAATAEVARAVMQDTNGVARLGTNTLAISGGTLYINGVAFSGSGGSFSFSCLDLTNRVLALESSMVGTITNLVALSTNVVIGVTNQIAYVNATGMGSGGGTVYGSVSYDLSFSGQDYQGTLTNYEGTATSSFTQLSGGALSDGSIRWLADGQYWAFRWSGTDYFTNSSPVGTWTSADPATASYVMITTTP